MTDERVPLRVRHGVIFEPLIGYRAVRELNGERTYIGPWTTEERADAIVADSVAAWHRALEELDVPTSKGDAVLGVWSPATDHP